MSMDLFVQHPSVLVRLDTEKLKKIKNRRFYIVKRLFSLKMLQTNPSIWNTDGNRSQQWNSTVSLSSQEAGALHWISTAPPSLWRFDRTIKLKANSRARKRAAPLQVMASQRIRLNWEEKNAILRECRSYSGGKLNGSKGYLLLQESIRNRTASLFLTNFCLLPTILNNWSL